MVDDGIRLSDGSLHELDIIICASGFNAFDGSFSMLHVEERNEITLS